MFYSYDILNHQNGKLALMWLAAHEQIKGDSRSLRKVLNVRVDRACDDILRDVTCQGPSSSRPFSLYLSSTLMYGTIKIYKRQMFILYKEASEASQNCQKPLRELYMGGDLDAPVRRSCFTYDEDKVFTLPQEYMDIGWTLDLPSVRRTPGKKTGKQMPKRRKQSVKAEEQQPESHELDTPPHFVSDQESITMKDEDNLVVSAQLAAERREFKTVELMDLGPSFSIYEGPTSDPNLDKLSKSLTEYESSKRGLDRGDQARSEVKEEVPEGDILKQETIQPDKQEKTEPSIVQPVEQQPGPQPASGKGITPKIVVTLAVETPRQTTATTERQLLSKRKRKASGTPEEDTPVPPHRKTSTEPSDESQVRESEGLFGSSNLTGLSDITALQTSYQQDISAGSLSKSSIVPKPMDASSLIQDTTHLLPNEEQRLQEEAVRKQPRKEGQAALTLPEHLALPRPPKSKRLKKQAAIDEEIHPATPEGTTPCKPQQSSYISPEESPVRGPIRSPTGGLSVVTVQADVHHPSLDRGERAQTAEVPMQEGAGDQRPVDVVHGEEPQVLMTGDKPQVSMPGEEPQVPVLDEKPLPAAEPQISMLEIFASTKPFQPAEPSEHSSFIPSFISPIKKHSQTPTTINFEDLLPENAIRLEVARIFTAALGMHKKGKLKLDQQKSYGTIPVTRL